MKYYKLSALLLAAALLFSLAACKPEADGPTGGPTQEPTATVSVSPTAEPSEEPSAGPVETPDCVVPGEIRLAVLSGPTGIGAAKLLDSIDNSPASLSYGNYGYTIYTDNSELVAGLVQGRIDIATMASNMAVNLYNKNGGVTIIAAGTLGVLHILEGGGGTEINSIADLAGKTVWSVGEGANPEYILRYLLEQNDLTDVEVRFAADPSEILAGLKSGQIRYAMLPVPAATAAIAQGEGQIRAAVDVTEAWDELQGGRLVMTAVVARTEYLETYPDLVDHFLTDYERSIDYVNNNPDAAAELVAGYGLTPNAAIAKQAIPQCHLAFLSGNDMMSALSDYYLTLYAIDPASVGGSLPSDSIYYIP